jgi:hypothetical protein
MNKDKELSASEAIFSFCGWLSTRNEETVFSAKNDCAVIADRIKEFLKINNLPEPRPGWEDSFKHPSNII